MATIERNLYLRVVSMTAQSAKEFIGSAIEPVDLGEPADKEKWLPGARVWGFPSRPETRAETAKRKFGHPVD